MPAIFGQENYDPYVIIKKGRKTMYLDFSRLRDRNILRCETGFGHKLNSWSVLEWGGATAGECGEANNVAKKMLRFRDNIKGNDPTKTRDDYKKMLASEIAGMVIYADLWCASEGIDLAQAIIEEFNKKSDEIGANIKL